ncbi:MAG TPA: cation:proton antiporter [Solirubrobacteraceae bacterium]|jgi:Kef-type K+ transport system membrane component KefB
MSIAHVLPVPLAAIDVKSPTGAAWEFLVLFLVVIVGPPVLERARLPGIIGLLVGGYVIGPHGLNLIGAGNATVPELGQIGLLYLMFVAGVELDLALLRVHRREVIMFGLITFLVPMALGSTIGFALNWSTPAALLLGSLVASHTLLVYPAVRNAGLSTHPAVATAVGATVITDTASLIVLAAVSGSQLVGGSAVTIGLQIAFGLVVLVVFSLMVLPRLVRLAFRVLGTDRIVRYLLAIASFLAAATLAAMVGIEGLVGAFFAGLGLNRLVPNEGPLMERIDFFGSAVFIPIFLVSVGMLLQPSVMVEGETLKLAGLFILASLGGKVIAAAASKRPLHASFDEAALMVGLTVPQAAATLAATVIGFNIGLFDQSVVNAVLVLILVSIVAATLITDRYKRRVAVPQVDALALGKRVLVALEDPDQAQIGFTIGARVAAPDSGVIRALLGCRPTEKRVREASLVELQRVGFAVGVDVDPKLLVDASLAEGIINVAAEQEPSFVLVGQRSASAHPAFGGSGEAVAAAITSPVAILIGEAARISEVVLFDRGDGHVTNGQRRAGLAAELAARIGGKGVTVRRPGDAQSFHDLAAGQLWIAGADSGEVLAASDPPEGAALMLVLDPPPRGARADLDLIGL